MDSTTTTLDGNQNTMSSNSEAPQDNVPGPVSETVTLITAKTLNPGEASKKIFKEQGSFYTFWQIWEFLLEANGLKEKKIDTDYEHIPLDEVAKRGRFPYRPSDLFLKVIPLGRVG
jgi:hypothetical protein